jgi:hypothetical protein
MAEKKNNKKYFQKLNNFALIRRNIIEIIDRHKYVSEWITIAHNFHLYED